MLHNRVRTKTSGHRIRGAAAAVAVLLLVALSSSQVGPSLAQDKPDPSLVALELDRKLMASATQGSEIMANLTYLSDVIGPRLTGSANLRRANDWAMEKMKSYGLTDVRLEAWEVPTAWERGTATARLVEPDNGKVLTVAAMGWTPGTNGKIVGDVVIMNARTPEDFKQYEGKLRNAIVMRNAPTTVRPITDLSDPVGGAGRPQRSTESEKATAKDKSAPAEKAESKDKAASRGGRPGGFDSRGGDFMRFRRELAEFLRREGAAVMISDAGKPHGLLNMTGSWGGRDRVSAQDPLPTLFMAHENYAMLYRLATRADGPKPRLEIEISNKFIDGPIAVYNTVGEIRGTQPDEFVVVGAHLDSWDLGQGTTDNGTGTCVVLEAARILAKSGIKPKRTIRFVLFSGEEQGLHGSKAFVQKHKPEMPKTSAAIVHDTGTGKIVGISLMGRDILKPIMEAELASLKELGVTDISPRSMGGSDHQSFESEGVPGFMFRQDPAEYRLTHHSQSDTLDKAREPDLVQGAQVMSVIAARLANRAEMLPRDKKPADAAADKAQPKSAPKSGDG